MRLWHKELIPFLPRQQLISQWRELCCIAKNININNTPNHLLVNKIMDYNLEHLIMYTKLVINEMNNRNYNISQKSFNSFLKNLKISKKQYNNINLDFDDIFSGWHNKRYYKQCYYNLEEKYDCGGIFKSEFKKIRKTSQY